MMIYLRRGNNLDSLSKLASHYSEREHYLELIGFRNEAESLKLKQDLISQILEKQLSLRAARKLLNDTIVVYLGDGQAQKTASKFDYLDKIKIAPLTPTDQQLLSEKLENLCKILRE